MGAKFEALSVIIRYVAFKEDQRREIMLKYRNPEKEITKRTPNNIRRTRKPYY